LKWGKKKKKRGGEKNRDQKNYLGGEKKNLRSAVMRAKRRAKSERGGR